MEENKIPDLCQCTHHIGNMLYCLYIFPKNCICVLYVYSMERNKYEHFAPPSCYKKSHYDMSTSSDTDSRYL